MGSMTRLEKKPNAKCRKWRLFVSRGSGEYRVQESERFEGTYTEARARLADMEREFAGLPATDKAFMTFRELADEWLESRRGKVEETTVQKNCRSMTTACWVIGSVRICDIKPSTLSDAYTRMREGESPSGRELSGNYVRQVGTAISQALQHAVDRGYLSANPARSDDLPKHRVTERVPPSAAEIARALDLLDPADARQMCAYLCASMGLRKGEALGLRWKDIDGDVMHVRHSLRQPRELAPCKTGAGLRDLPIPPHVQDALRRRMSALQRGYGKLVDVGVAEPLDSATWPQVAVCAQADGLVVTSETMGAWWTRYGRKLTGLDCSLHGLRHAYLTAAAVNGVPPRVMQALAGHASPVTTMRIYAHANMDAKQAASEIVASVLHPKSEHATV